MKWKTIWYNFNLGFEKIGIPEVRIFEDGSIKNNYVRLNE